jgi:hypothetical protein
MVHNEPIILPYQLVTDKVTAYSSRRLLRALAASHSESRKPKLAIDSGCKIPTWKLELESLNLGNSVGTRTAVPCALQAVDIKTMITS